MLGALIRICCDYDAEICPYIHIVPTSNLDLLRYCALLGISSMRSLTSLNNEHIRGRRLVCEPITIQNLITDCTHIAEIHT